MPGLKETLLESLRQAALFTEPSEHRFRRRRQERLGRESDARIEQGSRRLSLSEADSEDRRQSRGRLNTNDDLRTRLELTNRGVALDQEQSGARARGEPFGVDVGGGLNIGSGGGSVVDFEEDEFFVPGGEASHMIGLRRNLEEAEEMEKLRTIAVGSLPGKLQQLIPEGTRMRPEALDDLLRAGAALEPDAATFDKVSRTDPQGNLIRTFIKPDTGERRDVNVGPTRQPGGGAGSASQARLRQKDKLTQRVQSEASRIFLENGGDASKALDDLERQAQFDSTGFLSENAVAIADRLKRLQGRPNELLDGLKLIFGDNIPPEVLQQAQGAAAAPQDGSRPSVRGSAQGDRTGARKFLDQF